MAESNPVITPGVNDEPLKNEGGLPLNDKETTKYKSSVARANFLALDRPITQYAVKECGKAMSSPTVQDMARLKRLGRYLKGHMRTITMHNWQRHIDTITIHTDANWAGDRENRKSTSGGFIMIGDHLIKTWSKGPPRRHHKHGHMKGSHHSSTWHKRGHGARWKNQIA